MIDGLADFRDRWNEQTMKCKSIGLVWHNGLTATRGLGGPPMVEAEAGAEADQQQVDEDKAERKLLTDCGSDDSLVLVCYGGLIEAALEV